MKRDKRTKLAVLMCLGLLTSVVSKRFNKIALDQRPSQAPFQTIDINRFEERCLSICSRNTNCYSFLIDQSNPNGLKCLLYNTTVDYLQLGGGNPPQKSEFYSSEMTDCLDWYDVGARETGIYTIVISGIFSKRVRCNMDVDGGGWLVFQYRHNGTVDFLRNWEDYKHGFGSLESEFWLGNDLLHHLTTTSDHEAYIQGQRFSGEFRFAKYPTFEIGNEAQKYQLRISGSTGVVGSLNNNALFSTLDNDNDNWTGDCSSYGTGTGGFWFTSCGGFQPNAYYYNTESVPADHGMLWYALTTSNTCLLYTSPSPRDS